RIQESGRIRVELSNRHRQYDRELAADADFAADGDVAAVNGYDALDDGQPQAGVQTALRRLPVGVENVRQVFGRDAFAGVRHRDLNKRLSAFHAGAADHASLDTHAAAGRGILERVIKQIGHDPAHFYAVHIERGQALRDGPIEGDAFARGQDLSLFKR